MQKSLTIADVQTRIHTLRGVSVLLDGDLAELYGVSVKALLQAVRRNPGRFPADFICHLTNQELAALRSQTVTSKPGDPRGGRDAGVAMLSSVLRSPVAVQVNIEIMRAFVRLRRATLISGELMKLIEDLPTRVDSHESVLGELAEAIRQLTESPPESRTLPIGFTADWGR